MGRDDARKMFSDAGLSLSHLSREDLKRLAVAIDVEMKAAGLMKGTYRCNQRIGLRGWPEWAEIGCRSYYFEKREAVTFNRDGFVGFAGWADETHVQPILAGFSKWVSELIRLNAGIAA